MLANTVMFECSFQMNRSEIKDYLKDIYNLDAQQINIEVCSYDIDFDPSWALAF